MRAVRKGVEAVIRGKAESRSPLERLLWAASVPYGAAVRLRETLYRMGFMTARKLPRPVVSIGNMTVGGTGKTPMAVYLAELLGRCGYRVAVLSRGYGGRMERTGGLVSDGGRIVAGPDLAGDEPFLMARSLPGVPVLSGKNRYRSGMRAIHAFGSQVLILDDAFQHLELKRDVNLLLADSRDPFGNGRLLPAGPLREPLCAMGRADGVVLTRSDSGQSPFFRNDRHLRPEIPVFRSVHLPMIQGVVKAGCLLQEPTEPADASMIGKKAVCAFSGLAQNEYFRRTIEELGCRIAGFFPFPDHHRYATEDLKAVFGSAARLGAAGLLTTEKDYVRLCTSKFRVPADLYVVGVRISFGGDAARFEEFILDRLGKAGPV